MLILLDGKAFSNSDKADLPVLFSMAPPRSPKTIFVHGIPIDGPPLARAEDVLLLSQKLGSHCQLLLMGHCHPMRLCLVIVRYVAPLSPACLVGVVAHGDGVQPWAYFSSTCGDGVKHEWTAWGPYDTGTFLYISRLGPQMTVSDLTSQAGERCFNNPRFVRI